MFIPLIMIYDKKRMVFMQTPKEKAYNLDKKFYNVDGQDFTIQ